MIYILTKKNIALPKDKNQAINNEIRRIDHLLPYINLAFPIMWVNIVKSGKLYNATLRLPLPKQVLYTHFLSDTPSQAIHLAFERLLKIIKKYKDLHFKSRSDYPNHKSIRGEGFAVDENAYINVTL